MPASCRIRLGLFYSAFTAFLGFEVNEGEYKVMGMAGFGEPAVYDKIRKLVELLPNGLVRMDERYFSFTCPGAYPFTDKLIELLGSPREPESAFDIGTKGAPPADEIQKVSRHYADIAASVQRVAEDMIFHIVLKAVERTGIPDVCMAGGVALNSLANGKLQKMLKGRLYMQPAAGDAGSALGAALSYYHGRAGGARGAAWSIPYIGKSFTDDEFVAALAGLAHDDLAPFRRRDGADRGRRRQARWRRCDRLASGRARVGAARAGRRAASSPTRPAPTCSASSTRRSSSASRSGPSRRPCSPSARASSSTCRSPTARTARSISCWRWPTCSRTSGR